MLAHTISQDHLGSYPYSPPGSNCSQIYPAHVSHNMDATIGITAFHVAMNNPQQLK